MVTPFDLPFVGAWRSLVAHLHGVQGVGGSNPLAPTIGSLLFGCEEESSRMQVSRVTRFSTESLGAPGLL